jgi:hypothetical protein
MNCSGSTDKLSFKANSLVAVDRYQCKMNKHVLDMNSMLFLLTEASASLTIPFAKNWSFEPPNIDSHRCRILRLVHQALGLPCTFLNC